MSYMSFIKYYVNSNNIVIFSNANCIYCNKAKALLNIYSNHYNVIELNKNPNGIHITGELYRFTNQKTEPSIFLYGKHIGGYFDLKQLHDSGELKSIIYTNSNELSYPCNVCGRTYNTQYMTCGCYQTQFSDWGEPI